VEGRWRWRGGGGGGEVEVEGIVGKVKEISFLFLFKNKKSGCSQERPLPKAVWRQPLQARTCTLLFDIIRFFLLLQNHRQNANPKYNLGPVTKSACGLETLKM
jgi:hypothetical protein